MLETGPGEVPAFMNLRNVETTKRDGESGRWTEWGSEEKRIPVITAPNQPGEPAECDDYAIYSPQIDRKILTMIANCWDIYSAYLEVGRISMLRKVQG